MSTMDGWDDDERLIGDLDDALAGAVTDRARADARAAFTWRTIDQDLMSLVHDSALSGPAVVRRSGPDGPRVIGFRGTDFTLEVEIDGQTLMGQLVPGRVCRVSVVSPDGEPGGAVTDESGFFSSAAPPPGPVRFTVTCGAATQSTEWVTL
jgi:hypothetical protein